VPSIGPELQPLGIEPVPRQKYRSGTFKNGRWVGRGRKAVVTCGQDKNCEEQEPQERCRALAGPARPCDASGKLWYAALLRKANRRISEAGNDCVRRGSRWRPAHDNRERKPAGAKRKRRSGNESEVALSIQRDMDRKALKGQEPQERRLAGLSRRSRGEQSAGPATRSRSAGRISRPMDQALKRTPSESDNAGERPRPPFAARTRGSIRHGCGRDQANTVARPRVKLLIAAKRRSVRKAEQQ